MKELLLSFLFALVVGSVINGCQTPPPSSNTSSSQGQSSGTTAATESSDETFKSDVLEAATPVVVDFGATWCAPCKVMNPIFDSAANKFAGKVKFVHVDIDKNPEVVDEYKIGPIPTFLVFKNGERVDSFGPRSAEAFESTIQKYANN